MAKQVARMSAATSGTHRRLPGYRFAHPGYARYRIGRAGRRGVLPRERFSPLARSGHSLATR